MRKVSKFVLKRKHTKTDMSFHVSFHMSAEILLTDLSITPNYSQ